MAFTNSKSASENAHYYDEQWSRLTPEPGGEQEKARIRAICQALEDFGNPKDNKLILDLGCGRGWMTPYLSKYGKVYGVDFSEVGIQFAQAHFSDLGTFILANSQEPTLGLGDLTFDIVVSSEVVEHVPSQEDYIRLILDLLNPQGHCILTTPNGNLWSKYSKESRFKNHLQPVENWLTPAKFRSLIVKAGLKYLRHEGIPIHKLRLGRLRWMQHKYIQYWVEKFNLGRVYGKIVLPHALYQIIVARK